MEMNGLNKTMRRILILVISALIAGASHHLVWNLWAVPKLSLLASEVCDVYIKEEANLFDALVGFSKKPGDESSRRFDAASEKALAASSAISARYLRQDRNAWSSWSRLT